jgi:Xaa-Pro aminopeptidase
MKRLERVRRALSIKADALLVASGDRMDMNFQYLSGVDALAAGGVFYWRFAREPFAITWDYRHGASVRKIRRAGKGQLIEEAKKRGRPKRVGVVMDALPASSLAHFRKEFSKIGARLVDVSKELAGVRAIKEKGELRAMQKAARETRGAFKTAKDGVEDGETEAEIAGDIAEDFIERGLRLAFDPIVQSGPNCQFVHSFPTKRKIRASDTVIVDIGCRVNGYCSDFTRTFCVEPSRKQETMLGIVREASLLGQSLVRPGVRSGEPYEKVREFLGASAKYWNYSLGHGVGLDVHETPWLAKEQKARLAEGMTVTVEPGLAVPGVGGSRIENTGVVTRKGFKIL